MSAHAEGSLSGSSSAKQASEQQQDNSGQLAITETKCITSRVQRDMGQKAHLSSEFIRDLANCVSPGPESTGDLWEELVKKYGTHYYTEASLGGKLQMITSVEKSHFFSQSSSETSSSLEGSFSAGASGGGYSGSAAASYAGANSGEKCYMITI